MEQAASRSDIERAESETRVVGIGASAGGLEALQRFLGAVPAGSGRAFVVIQHLAPTSTGMIVELLQRATHMPVAQVVDRMELQPDHVYVIPPASDMSILDGRLHLLEPFAPRGLRLPVDFFFRSLAIDRLAGSIGVVLSGTGSDGTLGVRAIKEHAGAVFVQAPDTAKFDGMPRSVIDEGLADVVAPPEELPGKILDFARPAPDAGLVEPEEADRDGIDKVMIVLRAQTGQDFSSYKLSTMSRRIARRMALHQLSELGEYVRLLRENPAETELLAKELLIGVTRFFRDMEVWDNLRDEVLPKLLAEHAGDTLRAWVPACSTGEEAYSLAMVFREAVERARMPRPCSLKIFATDLDADAIDRARSGTYPSNIAVDVSEDRLDRFFRETPYGYQLRSEIRETIVFARQNLIMDPPFTKLDLLVCRNLMIYFNAELQQRALRLFHYSLKPGGILMLGVSETVGDASVQFETISGRDRIYLRRATAEKGAFIEFPNGYQSPGKTPATERGASGGIHNLQSLVSELMLREHAPPAVLTTSDGDILYVSGRIGSYLEPAAGKATMNALAMAREELRDRLSETFYAALQEGGIGVAHAVPVTINGMQRAVDITVEAISEPPQLAGTRLIVFDDVPPVEHPVDDQPGAVGRIDGMALELREARDRLRSMHAEMQTSQEELRSVNEEMQSTNEELQSMNEELQTVNAELHAKLDELIRVGDDLRNLLDSTDIGVLFLDGTLNVRRFTPRTVDIIKLQPGDVGRPITDLATELDYDDLADDLARVVETSSIQEREVPASEDRWYRVRIMPYRTQHDLVDGILITFTDVSASKRLEQQLRIGQA